MDYYGIGFSNIRLPNDSNNSIYTYSDNLNTFPEEVYVHEFLHSLERTLQEYGYDIPQLHDYEKYGYKSESLVRYKKWYSDYMQQKIRNNNGEYVGLDSIVYKLKPTKEREFVNSNQIEFVDEKNDLISIVKHLVTKFNNSREEAKNEA